jgi:hypothetical protein
MQKHPSLEKRPNSFPCCPCPVIIPYTMLPRTLRLIYSQSHHYQSTLQESLAETCSSRKTTLPLRDINPVVLTPISIHATRPPATRNVPQTLCAFLNPQGFPCFQLSFQSQCPLLLFSQFPLCSPCTKLLLALTGLQLIDRPQQLLNLVVMARDVLL